MSAFDDDEKEPVPHWFQFANWFAKQVDHMPPPNGVVHLDRLFQVTELTLHVPGDPPRVIPFTCPAGSSDTKKI